MFILYTAPTPNGWKTSIMLEELGLPYRVEHIDLASGNQKSPEFLAINPNGRIPALVDEEKGITVFESGATLIYLAEKSGQLLASSGAARYQALQWLMFQMAGVGPMQGQANIFSRYFPEKIPAVISRYQNETRRLYGVLDGRLKESPYLAGEDYSIADIANYTWPLIHAWAGIDIAEFPDLQRWMQTLGERPALKRGLNVPVEMDFDALLADPERAEQAAKVGSKLITR